MATTVSLVPSSWNTTSQSSTISITASGTSIKFHAGYKLTDEMIHAKAYFSLNLTNYNSITLNFTSRTGEGLSDLSFGVFSSTSPGSSSGTGVTDISSKSSGTVTIDTSSLSGTYYIGFQFYGNTYVLNDSVGWAVTQSCTISSLTGELAANTISYKPGSYASGTTYSQTKNNDATATLRGVTYYRTGYTQTGWSTSSTGSSKSYELSASYTTNSDITLYPYWTANSYTITFNNNGGTSGSTTSSSITYGTIYNQFAYGLINCSKEDHEFNGFYTAASGGTKIIDSKGKPCTNTICFNDAGQWIYAGNITLYAQYTKNVFTIMPVASVPSQFETSLVSKTVTKGGSVTVSATTKDKYAFDYWQVGSYVVSSGGSYDNKSVTVSDNGKTGYLTITNATAADEGSYTAYAYREISISCSGSGCTVAPSSFTIKEGSSTNLTASYSSNYIFQGWTLPNGTVIKVGENYDNGRIYCEKTSSGNLLHIDSLSETDEGNYVATAEPLTFITPIAGTGVVSVSGGVNPYTIGSTVTLSCTITAGYKFYRWTLPDGTQLGKNESSGNVTVNSDGSLTITSVTASNAGYYTVVAAINFVNKKYHSMIYNGSSWQGLRTIIIRKMLVPTNAIVDVNGVPILTSDGEYILVDENTEGLTAEYIYTDYRQHVPYIAMLLSTPENVAYLSENSPVYMGVGKYVYIQK